MLNALNSLVKRARPWIPFTALNTVWCKLDKSSKTILDVGCGKGEPIAFINRRRKFHVIGVDVFLPYMQQCRKLSAHESLILADVRKLPFKPKACDTVICMEVLEHMGKEEGEVMLNYFEKIARK